MIAPIAALFNNFIFKAALLELLSAVLTFSSGALMPLVKCPHCGKRAEYSGNEFRPFCSERCKLLDFGAWIDGEFRLPTESPELTEEDIAKIDSAREADK